MILAALIEYDVDGTTSYLGVADGEYTDTTGVSIDLWYPALQSDVSWSEQARHPYQEQGGELSVGDLMIANDGTFDWLMDADIVGMKVTVKRGEAHETFAQMEQVFIARTSGRRFDGHSVIIELDNWLAKLSGPVSTETFDSDTPNPQLVGKQIPYVLGKVTQAPVLEYNPQQLGYYTALNASLIGEVTEGGNPTQRWYLDEQPIFRLKGSPTLPITATFEGPSDTGWTTVIDDDLNDWVAAADTSLGSVYISQGNRPDGWTLVIGDEAGLDVSQSAGLRINDASSLSGVASTENDVTTTSAESFSEKSSSVKWADAGLAVRQDAGAATITTGGDKTDEIKVTVGNFQSASVKFSTSHVVTSGNIVLDSVTLRKDGEPVYREIFDSLISGAGIPIRLGQLWDFALPSDFSNSVDLHIKLKDNYSGDYSLYDFFLRGEYISAPSVHLRKDLSLNSGEKYSVMVEGSTSDDVSFMWGAYNNTAADWPEHNDYAGFISQDCAEKVTGGFELNSIINPSGGIFNLSYQPAYGALGDDYRKGDVTITRIKITKQSAGNKSYKSLVPHIVNQAGYTSAEVDQPSIDAHADKYGDPELGWLITGQESADQVLFRLAGSLFGYLWHGLDGKVRSKKIEAPGPIADPFVINDANCDPADIVAFDDEAPNLRRSVNALRNWQPINPDRTAGITTTWTEEDRAKVTADWRITRDWEMDTAGKAEFARRWPNVAAREPFSTALRDAIIAQLVANQGPDQWIEKPMFFEVPVYVPLGQLSKVAVGETVKAELDYPGLDNEWLLVLGRAGTAQPGMVNLTLWSAGLVPVTLLAPYRFDPRITFTRASVGTYFDADMVLQTAAVDEPRLDHGPTGPKGWLFEEARTNLLLNSNGPVTQTVTVANGTVYTLSVHGAGSAALSGAGTGTATAGSPVTFTASTTSATVTVTGSLDYFQIEAGASASSIIITGATAVTRAVDNALIDGTPFADMWNPAEGTIALEVIPADAGVQDRNALSINDGTTNHRIGIRALSAGTYNALGVTGGSGQFFLSSSASVQAGVPARVALGLRQNDVGFSVNEESALTNTTVTMPTVTQMQIGNGALGRFAGHIANLHYYPKRLTNTQLRAASVVGRDLIREKI